MPESTCRECGKTFSFTPPDYVPAFAAHLKPDTCNDCAGRLREVEQLERLATDLRERNIPRRYLTASFESFAAATPSQRLALEACRDHALEGVLLRGPSGTGKTMLGSCAIMAGPPDSLFVGTTELLDDIRASFDGGGRDLFERAQWAPLLCLDDLGAEAVTDWVRDRLYVLLNDRWNGNLPLVVTTNHTAKTLAERIGDHLLSRIAGLCDHRVEAIGEDRRRRHRFMGEKIAASAPTPIERA
jgi:DNA replication protein DnaC